MEEQIKSRKLESKQSVEMESRVADLGYSLSPLVETGINHKEKQRMRDSVDQLFSFISDGPDEIDVTCLKHMLHKANVHSYNPALFKAVNEASLKADFTSKWSRQQFN